MRYDSPARLDGGIGLLEQTQVAVSRSQELRKECPFNVFMVKLLDFCKLLLLEISL